MSYPKEVVDFILLKSESIQNKTAIARAVVREFNLDKSVDSVRNKVKSVLANREVRTERKRLFFDIEMSYVLARLWGTGEQYIRHDNIIDDKKIICVSYKWQYEDEVHTLKWEKNRKGEWCDKKVVKEFIKVLGEADEICAHNGDRFDIREIRTRAIKHRLLMFPKYRSLDTLKKARKYFNFQSNKLDYLGQVFKVGRKLDHEGFRLWIDCKEGSPTKSKKALQKMVDYCEQDVLLLEDVFNVMMPYIDHNTNYAVLANAPKWACPECASKKVKLHHTDTTPMGYIKRHMKCNSCKKSYHISNKSYQLFLTKDVIKYV